MNKMKRILALLLAAVLIASVCPVFAENDAGDYPRIETEVVSIKKYGHPVFGISATALMNLGYEAGDVVRITIADRVFDVPLCFDYSDVENDDLLCRLDYHPEDNDDAVMIAINAGDFATRMGLAEKIPIESDPGYRWEYAEGVPSPLPVIIEMKEKGGYLAQYQLHHLERSTVRADYPDLTDEEYANFRVSETTGMGKGVLCRSSSPVDPQLNRNAEADAALFAAGVRTILNLSDDATTMKAFEGYADTYYSKCNIIALNLGMDISAPSFQNDFVKGLRFMLENDGPYLLHCMEGKDRTGYAAAVLEALMGATFDEICADYMKTYMNFFGVEPNTEKYDLILNGNFLSALPRIFHSEVSDLENADLSACAAGYLRECGLTNDEIAALKEQLSKNYAD